MIDRSVEWIAAAAGGEQRVQNGYRCRGSTAGPRRVVFDAGECGSEDLFVALHLAGIDAAEQAATALGRGAWGVLVAAEDAAELECGDRPLIVVQDPLRSLQSLALAWRRQLAATVVGITGSCGKTSTKDILSALLSKRWRVHATDGNYNNEVGIPVSILAAERGTEVLILEMGTMRQGKLSDFAQIARPDLGVVLNIGPSHLKKLGSVEGVARAKAELISSLPEGGACVIPAEEPLLRPYLREDLRVVTFGAGGDVVLRSLRGWNIEVDCLGERVELELSYDQPYNLRNTLAAVGVAAALGYVPGGQVEPTFSPLRGEKVALGGGATLINDCYNANPLSVHAALQHLTQAPARRRIAVLGQMAELGAMSHNYHVDMGRQARVLGVDLLIGIGEHSTALAAGFQGPSYRAENAEQVAALLLDILDSGDLVLIKGSRSARLERIAELLQAPSPRPLG